MKFNVGDSVRCKGTPPQEVGEVVSVGIHTPTCTVKYPDGTSSIHYEIDLEFSVVPQNSTSTLSVGDVIEALIDFPSVQKGDVGVVEELSTTSKSIRVKFSAYQVTSVFWVLPEDIKKVNTVAHPMPNSPLENPFSTPEIGPKSSDTCKCEIRDLMNFGCRCGGFQKECSPE